LEKTDFNSVINGLRIRPLSKSCLSISLCRLEPLPLVRPILEFDVQLLENEFLNGYREGDRVLYVSIFNDRGDNLCVTEDKVNSWDPIWQQGIHRIRSFKTLKLQEFKNLLSPDDYAKCEKKRPLSIWYPLTAYIFATFIYKVSL
jgi:hypothetical protein